MAENIREVRQEMDSVKHPAGKKTTLVLVSKLKPPSDILAARESLDSEDRHFGENYVQEVCLYGGPGHIADGSSIDAAR